MANNERLTKRVKKIEEWVAENEEMGGPKGYLDAMVAMFNTNVNITSSANNLQRNFEQMRGFTFEFIKEHDLEDEWNEFLVQKEKDAVQVRPSEEISTQEEAESGEETIEAPEEESSEKKD